MQVLFPLNKNIDFVFNIIIMMLFFAAQYDGKILILSNGKILILGNGKISILGNEKY